MNTYVITIKGNEIMRIKANSLEEAKEKAYYSKKTKSARMMEAYKFRKVGTKKRFKTRSYW
jgi:hypothetical protein